MVVVAGPVLRRKRMVLLKRGFSCIAKREGEGVCRLLSCVCCERIAFLVCGHESWDRPAKLCPPPSPPPASYTLHYVLQTTRSVCIVLCYYLVQHAEQLVKKIHSDNTSTGKSSSDSVAVIRLNVPECFRKIQNCRSMAGECCHLSVRNFVHVLCYVT